jgi:hypothetical protein
MIGAAVGAGVVGLAGVGVYLRAASHAPTLWDSPANAESGWGWVMSPQDWRAMAKAERIPAGDAFEIHDGATYAGGEYGGERVSSVRECVQLCEADENCDAFSYARASHPNQSERMQCVLKHGDALTLNESAPNYISGRRR